MVKKYKLPVQEVLFIFIYTSMEIGQNFLDILYIAYRLWRSPFPTEEKMKKIPVLYCTSKKSCPILYTTLFVKWKRLLGYSVLLCILSNLYIFLGHPSSAVDFFSFSVKTVMLPNFCFQNNSYCFTPVTINFEVWSWNKTFWSVQRRRSWLRPRWRTRRKWRRKSVFCSKPTRRRGIWANAAWTSVTIPP